ncbi:delta 9-fatty acid desaturase protein [Melanogaster broomeanus]|nr:delta 9-fatty acid desaturase protein [Melanogaster broomeanus]
MVLLSDLPVNPTFLDDPERIPTEAVPDNYVFYTLKHQEALPPITWSNWYKELHWLHVFILCVPPTLGVIGAWSTPLTLKTAIWFFGYSHLTGIGLTAGYHRLWTHRAYNATKTLEYILAILGVGVVEGSIAWWARGHRAHLATTTQTSTPTMPTKASLLSYGWMISSQAQARSPPIVSDLRSNPVVKWQHKYYLLLAFMMAIVVPTTVAAYGWGDWRLLRLVFVQHSTFCVNSLCHWVGYHNFHHQFPMDYRNGHKWHHYDPSKWFIWTCQKLGLATHLKTFSDNEVQKGELTIQLRNLRQKQDALSWPAEKFDFQIRALICIAGYIHDISDFFDKHPGGPQLLKKNIGKDATPANAAHNVPTRMKRVGILLGGAPHGLDEKLSPSQHLRITRYTELARTDIRNYRS